jgi:hypothetical protein
MDLRSITHTVLHGDNVTSLEFVIAPLAHEDGVGSDFAVDALDPEQGEHEDQY